MPLIRIDTNRQLDAEDEKNLVQDLSALAAGALGKPESYVMIHLQPGQAMAFAGSDDPLANVEVKSIGLAASETARLSKLLCGFLKDRLQIEPRRVYIQFTPVPSAFWGWNSGTF
ncbi:phenylpyruvate tautomerase MIF-related protein [Telmatospirillum sp.]|uniref:phenylpyruvate tautomerase MIF-related protein n=1 Tax=Telmatospirillum sp. TaxID=2079197 RepID=UPI00283BC539|nr:phenylpyruvate tautomerase MIF-related protein [Telmatospirillum sp.]MDR3438871.1 phenylpyruvate tautomerase MIF-related protein [Telmatospirillum sp.]